MSFSRLAQLICLTGWPKLARLFLFETSVCPGLNILIKYIGTRLANLVAVVLTMGLADPMVIDHITSSTNHVIYYTLDRWCVVATSAGTSVATH